MQFNAEKAVEDWKARGFSDTEVQPLLQFYDRTKFAAMYFRNGSKPWETWPQQVESLNWYGTRKCHRSGRSTGKTKDLEINTVQTAVIEPNEEQLIAAQREQHIEPVMERIIQIFTTNPDLNALLKQKPQRSPDYRLVLKNNHIIWGRIGGPNGQNFQGMHVKYQRVEEAQEMTNKSWLELLPGLNDGGTRHIYGVPNGVRNRYYEFTHDSSIKLFSWNREKNPGTTEADIKEWMKIYGGKASADYIHFVIGEDGSQRYATFDIDNYLACVISEATFVEATLTKEDLKERSVKQLLNPLLRQAKPMFEGAYVLGADVGFTTDPTEITLWCDDGKFFQNFLRIKLEGWKLNEQREAIVYIDSIFPLSTLGIDRAGIGLGLQHDLQSIDERWNYITQGFHWGQNITVGVKPDMSEDVREAKTFAVHLIENAMSSKTVVLPFCKDREDQYINLTHEVRKQTGQIVYSEHNDHIVSSDMCAYLANYLQKIKLVGDEPDIGVILRPISFSENYGRGELVHA